MYRKVIDNVLRPLVLTVLLFVLEEYRRALPDAEGAPPAAAPGTPPAEG
jgi:hypothetical protein